jgi:hypothetical protein
MPCARCDHELGHWRAINPGVTGSVTVTSGVSDAQVRAVRGPDLLVSQADSAGSIPVTRSHVKAQARGCFSGLGLDRSRGLMSPRAINVPLAYRGEHARWSVVVVIVAALLGLDVDVDGVRDGLVCSARFV